MISLLRRACFSRHPFNNSIISGAQKLLSTETTSIDFEFSDETVASFDHDQSQEEEQFLQNDLKLAVNLLPEQFRSNVWNHNERTELIELVLDYGRKPLARFPSGDFILSEELVTESNVEDAVSAIGEFDQSNRTGLEGTLHRISCIRDRQDEIYGLTIRIGRALTTMTASMVEKPLKAGKSILLIGPPGVGKTSAIRNFCRVLSEECKKRVMIIDTTNEIAGTGWIPHHAIGTCRRMQVKDRSYQHNVMVEAVQNHMPEVIVIDEIGKEEECHAARSIAQRGVQLLATTHGHSLETMVKDLVLRELVGGINHVIIGDARAAVTRSNRKTILERVDASCFDVIVEMATRDRWRIHYDANKAVDSILRRSSPGAEIRYLDKSGNVIVEKEKPKKEENASQSEALAEAKRILKASTDLEVLQVQSGISREKLKECYGIVYQKVKKTDKEDLRVEKARARAQQTYCKMLLSYTKKESEDKAAESATQ